MDEMGAGWRPWLVAGASFAVLFLVALGWPEARRGYTDFLSFYAGARLAGTPNLYSPEHAREIQRPYSRPGEVRAFIRPPVYAVMLWPLGRLPYPEAHSLWQLLNVAALAGFIRLWAPGLPAVLLCCWYFPLWISFVLAQDIPLFLFCVALSAHLMRKRRPLAAGLVFALCGVKFHLFALLPLVIVAKRLGRFAAGFAAGGAAMLGVSFAAAGRDWPLQYLALLQMNERLQASQAKMANIKGLFSGLPHSTLWILLLAAAVAVCVWSVARRWELNGALAIMMAGGLLVSPHAYLPDCALLLPLLAVIAGLAGFDKAVIASLGISILSLALTSLSTAFLGQVALVIFFAWAVYVAHQTGRNRPEPAHAPE